MEEETAAFPDVSDFEFFVLILQDPSEKLKLPDKFAKLLDGQESREVTLREAGGGPRVWEVEVVFDGKGHMYLDRGWEQFARVHDLGLGHFLAFTYDGDAVLTIKVFDGSMCRRHYRHDDDDDDTSSESDSGTGGTNSIESGSNNSSSSEEMDIDDAPSAQFTVTLRQCNLGIKQNQYLNLPLEFLTAHGYKDMRKVVLRMRRGKWWPVTVKCTGQPDGIIRMSLKYGWHQFCVDNRLGVGDTCFFRALRRRDGEDYALKVEVLRRDGTFAD